MKPKLTKCKHNKIYHLEGPRIPMRYGGVPTIICTKCAMWAMNWDNGKKYQWHPFEKLKDAIQSYCCDEEGFEI